MKRLLLFPVLAGLWTGILVSFAMGLALYHPSGSSVSIDRVADVVAIWALVGIPVVCVGVRERKRRRVQESASPSRRIPAFLFSFFIPVVAVLLPFASAAWSAHRLQYRFQATVSRADRIVVHCGAYNLLADPSGDGGQIVLTVVTNAAEIAAFNQMIRFGNDISSVCCKCIGFPEIDWWRDGKRIARTSVHHGKAIWWDGFSGEHSLTRHSSAELRRWLCDRGIDPDSSSSVVHDALAKAEEDARGRRNDETTGRQDDRILGFPDSRILAADAEGAER